jgi:uncharacterized protein (DUF1015 family)
VSIVRPFKALRPKKDIIEDFSCPPYDVLEESEVKEIVSKKPENFLRVTRAEVDFKDYVDPHSDEVYKKASENLKNFESNGVLIQDEKPSYYIYRETWRGKSQTGIFATVSVDEYDEGLIKKHELTREEKEDDRTRHITTLSAQTGPVFLTFKSDDDIKMLLNESAEIGKKIADFVDENAVKHELWIIDNDEQVIKIKESFEKLDALYIADGHHRAAASSRTRQLKMKNNPNHDGKEEYNYFLAAIFPHDELRVLDYNRIVKSLNNMEFDDFINNLKDKFVVSKLETEEFSPKKLHEYGMYFEGTWYKLEAKEDIIDLSDPVKELDVYILQEYLLNPLLNIKDPRKDKNIHFIGGIKGIKTLENWVDNEGWSIAFSMFPTPLEQLINVADENKIMPPKSTWFEPKLRSGLLIHKI